MVAIGQFNYLQIVQQAPQGVYLAAKPYGKILLPKKYLPKGFQLDDWIDVFVYYDSEDRLIATTRKPLVSVGQFAYLKVKDVNETGAFLDWGLEKDLLVPFAEQASKMIQGHSYTVYVMLDKKTKRIIASSKIDKYLSETADKKFQIGQAVDLIVYRKTELGYSAIINNSHLGLLYQNEIFQPLRYGQKLKAFIKTIRQDGKIDLSLNRSSKQTYAELPEQIMQYLQQHNGISQLTDKSPPEEIYKTFAVSKANYKKALGKLYKERKILIEKDHISLVSQQN
ncbi:MAG: S1-like domain-containing RNA-binding protein [Chromatiales bacterium]|jgi:predicted RNA-binding protein (virulence factor B family)